MVTRQRIFLHDEIFSVEVTVKGPVSERTGMVMSFSELKRYMQEAIVDVMDHKNINVDVPHFQDHVATAENMCKFIWDSMAALMPDPSLLYQVNNAAGSAIRRTIDPKKWNYYVPISF